MGQYIKPTDINFLSLSGGTVTGNTIFTNELSATTFYGDGSNLLGVHDYYVTGGTNTGYTIVLSRNDGANVSFNLDSFAIKLSGDTYTTGGTFVNNQLNFLTSGGISYSVPIEHFTGLTIDYLLTAGTIYGAAISASTIYSGNTDLYDIFLTVNDGNDITRVQPGINITTGGTPNNPIINLISSPSVTNLTVNRDTSLQVVSATTIYSGSTELSKIFFAEYDIIDCGTF